MNIFVFGFFIVKLQISVSEPQFPPHIDLQKVGEAIFNNEKFNILKPTTHRVTDHFKEFMLRTDSSYHPAKRVFIDNNGFRHDWSGFGEKTKSLRKTDLKKVSGSFENAMDNTSESDIVSRVDNDNATATVEDNTLFSNGNENNSQEVENNASDNNDTVQNLTEEDSDTPESKETTTILKLFPAIQKNNSNTKITIVKRLRQGKDNSEAKPVKKADDPAEKEDTKKKAETTNKNTTKKPDDGKKDAPVKKKDSKKKDKKTDSGDKAKTHDKNKDGKADKKSPKAKKERTVVSTTFFCPYFGTITMSSFID